MVEDLAEPALALPLHQVSQLGRVLVQSACHSMDRRVMSYIYLTAQYYSLVRKWGNRSTMSDILLLGELASWKDW